MMLRVQKAHGSGLFQIAPMEKSWLGSIFKVECNWNRFFMVESLQHDSWSDEKRYIYYLSNHCPMAAWYLPTCMPMGYCVIEVRVNFIFILKESKWRKKSMIPKAQVTAGLPFPISTRAFNVLRSLKGIHFCRIQSQS
jgi:hypothetical protein